MFRIFVKYENEKIKDLWREYGISSSTTGSTSTFTPFETDDIEVLRNELIKLDSEIGHDSIRVVQDVALQYGVTVVEKVDDEDTTV